METALSTAPCPPRLVHCLFPPTPCHPAPAGARVRACPFLPAPPEAPQPHRSRRRAAGRPGSAGLHGFLVTCSRPPRAARDRTAGYAARIERPGYLWQNLAHEMAWAVMRAAPREIVRHIGLEIPCRPAANALAFPVAAASHMPRMIRLLSADFVSISRSLRIGNVSLLVANPWHPSG
jgi:hypothetical protein